MIFITWSQECKLYNGETIINPYEVVYARRYERGAIHICLTAIKPLEDYYPIYIEQQDIEEDIDCLWSRIKKEISSCNSNMISFEVINSSFGHSKINLEADSISGFLIADGVLLITFYDEREELPLRESDTKESLEDIYQQLCEAKGIESEVKG